MRAFALLAVLPLALSSTAPAQEAKKSEAPAAKAEAPKAAAKAPAKPAMPTQEQMMEAWMKAATPGEPHKKLEAMAGTWEAKSKAWMDPTKPPEETTGTMEMKSVLGGRFLEQRYEGTMMGHPFSGIGYVGYDNYKKRYTSMWIDSSATSIMTMLGAPDPKGTTVVYTGTVDDVVMKKQVKVKAIEKTIDADNFTYEMWGPAPDGKMVKWIEIHYTRKK